MENFPSWYQSSSGPQVAATVKGIVGLLIPSIKALFQIELVSDAVDPVIDATLILAFGAWSLWGYLRAKKVMQARISSLRGQVEKLASEKAGA